MNDWEKSKVFSGVIAALAHTEQPSLSGSPVAFPFHPPPYKEMRGSVCSQFHAAALFPILHRRLAHPALQPVPQSPNHFLCQRTQTPGLDEDEHPRMQSLSIFTKRDTSNYVHKFWPGFFYQLKYTKSRKITPNRLKSRQIIMYASFFSFSSSFLITEFSHYHQARWFIWLDQMSRSSQGKYFSEGKRKGGVACWVSLCIPWDSHSHILHLFALLESHVQISIVFLPHKPEKMPYALKK